MQAAIVQERPEPAILHCGGSARQSVSLERSVGCVRVALTHERGRTRLFGLRQLGSARAYMPRNGSSRPEVVLVNTSGGLTGGDRLQNSISIGESGSAVVTTQTAERIYRSSGGSATIQSCLNVEPNACLEWLPQETILFDRSRCRREVDVAMHSNSSLLLVEALVFGRTAMGEVLNEIEFTDIRRIRRGGVLIHADNFHVNGFFGAITNGAAALHGAKAVANVVYVAPDAEGRLAWARRIAVWEGVEIAASAWNGMLVMRFLSRRAMDLRRALVEFLTQFRGAELPRVWAI